MMRTIDLDDEWFDATIVSEAGATEVEQWLTPEERATARARRLEQQQVEWAASRIAAKVLLVRRGVTDDPLSLSLLGAARPTRVAADRDIFVSFSHTRGRGAATLGQSPVGIDIEVVRPLSPRLRKFFLTDADEVAVRDCRDDLMMHLWSAKEAAFKAVSTLELLTQVRFVECDAASDALAIRFVGANAGGEVRTIVRADLVIAVARIAHRGA